MIQIVNVRDFKKKEELIEFVELKERLTIIEAQKLVTKLLECIMYAGSNKLISSLLKQNGMDEAQIETAITQLNELREKL